MWDGPDWRNSSCPKQEVSVAPTKPENLSLSQMDGLSLKLRLSLIRVQFENYKNKVTHPSKKALKLFCCLNFKLKPKYQLAF